MEKQVATIDKKSNLPAHLAPEDTLRSDLVIPYVVLAQSNSESVLEKKAQIGDIVRSTSYEKLGDPEHPIEIVMLHNPRPDFVIEQQPKKDSRYEYRGTMARTPKNETLPWNYFADDEGNEVPEGTKGATKWRRVKRLTVMALLTADIAAAADEQKKVASGELPDPDKALTPVVLSFRVMSYDAGKALTTFFAKTKSVGAPVYRYSVTLKDKVMQNDQGTFYVWEMVPKSKPLAKEFTPIVEEWAAMVNAGVQFKTDEGADVDSFAQSTPADTTDIG